MSTINEVCNRRRRLGVGDGYRMAAARIERKARSGLGLWGGGLGEIAGNVRSNLSESELSEWGDFQNELQLATFYSVFATQDDE